MNFPVFGHLDIRQLNVVDFCFNKFRGLNSQHSTHIYEFIVGNSRIWSTSDISRASESVYGVCIAIELLL